jgi:hypothetical protein
MGVLLRNTGIKKARSIAPRFFINDIYIMFLVFLSEEPNQSCLLSLISLAL